MRGGNSSPRPTIPLVGQMRRAPVHHPEARRDLLRGRPAMCYITKSTADTEPPMINPEITAAIEAVIAPTMRRMGYRGLRIEEGEDHTGDPCLFIHVEYAADGDPIDTSISGRLVLDVRHRLLELGEERFPYVRNHFLEEQKVVGYP